MLKLVKLFLKLIEVGFYGKNLSITLSWKHARFFENDWIKTIGTRRQNCQKSFKQLDFEENVDEYELQLNFATISKIQHFIYQHFTQMVSGKIWQHISKGVTSRKNIFQKLQICVLNVKPSHYHKVFDVDTLYALLHKVLKRRRTFSTGSTRSIDLRNISLCTVIPRDNRASTSIFYPTFGFSVSLICTSASSCISAI